MDEPELDACLIVGYCSPLPLRASMHSVLIFDRSSGVYGCLSDQGIGASYDVDQVESFVYRGNLGLLSITRPAVKGARALVVSSELVDFIASFGGGCGDILDPSLEWQVVTSGRTENYIACAPLVVLSSVCDSLARNFLDLSKQYLASSHLDSAEIAFRSGLGLVLDVNTRAQLYVVEGAWSELKGLDTWRRILYLGVGPSLPKGMSEEDFDARITALREELRNG